MTPQHDIFVRRIAALAVVAGVVAGFVSLFAPPLLPAALPAAAAGDAHIRMAAPDLTWPSDPMPSGVRVEAPWTVGVPASGIVLTRGQAPRPVGAFVRQAALDGGTRWAAGDGRAPNELDRYRFREHVAGAQVSVVAPGGARRVCSRWVFGRWVCGPNDWNYVGATTIEARGRPQECIWAHPSADGVLHIRYAGVPRGGVLSGKHMLSDIAAQGDVPGVITLTIRVDGEVVSEREQELRRGLSTFRLTMPDGPPTADVEFEIAAETVAQRHFCFDAQMRDFPAPEVGE